MDRASFFTIKKFLSYLKPYWKKGLYAFLFMLLTAALQIPMPFLTKYLIDRVLPAGSFNLLNLIGLAILAVLLVRSLSGFLQQLFLAIFRSKVLFNIRTALFDHVQRAPLSFFHQKETGYLMSRLSDDVYAVEGLLATTLVSGAQNILLFLGGVFATLYLHPKLALLCFAILPLYLVSMIIFNSRIRSLSLQTREQFALVHSDLQELLSGVMMIKAFAAEQTTSLRYLSAVKRAIQSELRLDIASTMASIVSMAIFTTGPLLVIWYGGSEILHGRMTIGGLMAFLSFTNYLFGPVSTLYDLNLSVQRSLPAVDRILEMLGIASEKEHGLELEAKRGKIVFRNVSFSYMNPSMNGDRQDREAFFLDDVSLSVEPGQRVALVGKSGSGKTTIISLLMKFFSPAAGKIFIDDQDIAEANAKSLRKAIGWVSQDTFLFSDSIKENIRFGTPRATEADIERAASLAAATGFIAQLPDGFESKIGERGCNLSGGQRQRLAIARALIKDPKIIILDEATSQVDAHSERAIQDAMVNLLKDRTTIIIAHRLSTIMQAEMIFVIDNGRIVAQGTHQELDKNCSLYRELYAQFEA